MARRKNWAPGNVVEISLEDGSRAYGVVVQDPLMAFTRMTWEARPEVSERLFEEVAFRVWVMQYAIGKRGWPIVGHIELNEKIEQQPQFFKRDPITGQFYHYVDCVNDIPVSREECVGLECAAVWDPEHVESRLQDEKLGRPNKWAQSLSAESR